MHVFPADGDYVIKVSMHNEPLGGIYGRYSMLTMGIKEQVEVSVNGERVAADRSQPVSQRNRLRPERRRQRPRDEDAGDSHESRSAAAVGRLHPADRRSGGRS